MLTTACVALFAAGTADGDPGQAAEPTSVPARLPAGFAAALDQLALPEFAAGSESYIYCVADVTTRGRPHHNSCVPNPDVDSDELQKTIGRLMRRFRLSPATLAGRAVATEFYYRIQLVARGGVPRIRIYPNWGHSADRHGVNYDAPQRYEPRRFPPDCLFFVGVAKTPVDANGKATDAPEVITRFPMEEATLECIEKIRARHVDGKYIPAHRDGAAVAAIHVEVWGDPEKVSMDAVDPGSAILSAPFSPSP